MSPRTNQQVKCTLKSPPVPPLHQLYLVVRGWEEDEMNRWSTEDFQHSETIPYDTVIMNMCHYTFSKPMECTTPWLNHYVNYGPWLIMTCRCRFINCNNYTTALQDAASGGGFGCVEVGRTWERSALSTWFCCKTKTVLKLKYFFFK